MARLIGAKRCTQRADQDARQAAAADRAREADQAVQNNRLDVGDVGGQVHDEFGHFNIGPYAGAVVADGAAGARRAAKVGADVAVAAGLAGSVADHVLNAALRQGLGVGQHPLQPLRRIGRARRQLHEHGPARPTHDKPAFRLPAQQVRFDVIAFPTHKAGNVGGGKHGRLAWLERQALEQPQHTLVLARRRGQALWNRNDASSWLKSKPRASRSARSSRLMATRTAVSSTFLPSVLITCCRRRASMGPAMVPALRAAPGRPVRRRSAAPQLRHTPVQETRPCIRRT